MVKQSNLPFQQSLNTHFSVKSNKVRLVLAMWAPWEHQPCGYIVTWIPYSNGNLRCSILPFPLSLDTTSSKWYNITVLHKYFDPSFLNRPTHSKSWSWQITQHYKSNSQQHPRTHNNNLVKSNFCWKVKSKWSSNSGPH